MAKRGYRGPHPYNDTKVSPKNPSSNKYSSKLTTEYNKLNSNKKKYDYIRTHYFYPQATASVGPFTTDVVEDQTVTLISTDGTSKTYIGKTSENLANNHFKSNGNANVTATSLNDCIVHASGHNGKILSSRDNATLTLTQAEPGPDGNTTITKTGSWTGATVAAAFTGG